MSEKNKSSARTPFLFVAYERRDYRKNAGVPSTKDGIFRSLSHTLDRRAAYHSTAARVHGGYIYIADNARGRFKSSLATRRNSNNKDGNKYGVRGVSIQTL